MTEQLCDISVDDALCASIIYENKPVEGDQVILDQKTNNYIFSCPHCDMYIEVGRNEVNCAIFRHAFYFEKDSNGNVILTDQLNPHASKQICDSLIAEGKIYGCGKPFKLVRTGDTYVVQICDYI